MAWLSVCAGESDPIKKYPEEDPWIRSGTQVGRGWHLCGMRPAFGCIVKHLWLSASGTPELSNRHPGSDVVICVVVCMRLQLCSCRMCCHLVLTLFALVVAAGAQISEGSGRILVVATGTQSEWGKTMQLVGNAGGEDTPLQEKLADLAAAIGKIGFGVAVACFIALLIKW